jgi:hypothetical protein
VAALLKETDVAGERFMMLGSTLLVASKSQAGHWYWIEDAKCSCPGFTYRGTCRHVAAAQLEAEAVTDTSTTVEITTECGGGWIVKWAGWIHGGVHSRREDAEATRTSCGRPRAGIGPNGSRSTKCWCRWFPRAAQCSP